MTISRSFGAAARVCLALARDHGVTQGETVEALTQLAFYAGWPSVVTAISVARAAFAGAGR